MMHLVIVCLAVIGVAMGGQDDKFGNACQFIAGDAFEGTYGTTARAAAQTGQDFRLVIAQNNYAMFLSSEVAVFSRFIATDDFVTIADLAAAPQGNKCPTNHLSKYAAVWSDDCNTLELMNRDDPCGRRGGLLRGANGEPLVLTRLPCGLSQCGASSTSAVVYNSEAVDGSTGVMTVAFDAATVQTDEHGSKFFVFDVSTGTLVAHAVGAQYNTDACDYPTSMELALAPHGCGFDLSVVSTQCDALERHDGTEFLVDEQQCERAGPPAPAPAPATEKPRRHKIEHSIDRHFKVSKPPKYLDAGIPTNHRRYDHRGHELAEEARKLKKGAHVHKHHTSSSSSSGSDETSVDDGF